MLTKQVGYAKAKWSNNVYPYNDTTYLLKTYNGGVNWQKINIDTAFLNQFIHPLNGKFYFIDTLTGFTSKYITDEGMAIFKTTNGAKTWQKKNITGLEEAGLMPIELGGVTK